MMVRLTATCPDELVPTLAAEVVELGGTDVHPAYRAVHFQAPPDAWYAMHLKLRTASRLLRVVREVAAGSPQMLYDQAGRVPWPDLFASDRTFAIEAIAAEGREAAMPPAEIMRRVREGVVASFVRRGLPPPRVDLDAPRVLVVAHVSRGRCTLALDGAGKSLDKRGYRVEGHPAPLKETLAAAVLRLAGYDGSVPLADPFCGTGTLAIEAALVALHKAPLIHRPRGEFGLEWWADFDRDLWRHVQDQVRGERRTAPPCPIVASDVDPAFVELARRTALRARVERHVTFQAGPFQGSTAPFPKGLLVANLPYGTRIGGGGEAVKALYGEIGDTLKRGWQGWTAALLVARESPHKFIGLRPDRKVPLMNGPIPAWLLLFDIRPWKPRAEAGPDATAEDPPPAADAPAVDDPVV